MSTPTAGERSGLDCVRRRRGEAKGKKWLSRCGTKNGGAGRPVCWRMTVKVGRQWQNPLCWPPPQLVGRISGEDGVAPVVLSPSSAEPIWRLMCWSKERRLKHQNGERNQSGDVVGRSEEDGVREFLNFQRTLWAYGGSESSRIRKPGRKDGTQLRSFWNKDIGERRRISGTAAYPLRHLRHLCIDLRQNSLAEVLASR